MHYHCISVKPLSDINLSSPTHQQMRIALARLLLSPAGRTASSNGGGGLLLLDEPTNHLDSAAIRWLGQFLKNSTGTFVIVSHDEQLLEDACDHICEVS